MHDPKSGVEAYIRPYCVANPYTEYETPPKTPLHPFYTAYYAASQIRHIEAVTDERFEIEVILPADFDFKGYAYVQILIDIDGGSRTMTKCFKKSKIKTGNPLTHRVTSAIGWSSMRELGLTFGELVVDEHRDSSSVVHERQYRGNIKIQVERGWASLLSWPVSGEKLQQMESYECDLTTSKWLAENYGKTHGLK